jgi:hypothetical protein
LVLYLIIFNGKLSNSNADWGAFGDYIGGVSNFLNVIILVLISILLKNIDQSQKQNEINIQLKISFFTRFLTSYEEVVHELSNMKIYLSVEDIEHKQTDIKKMVLESFKKFKYMITIFQNYIPISNKTISFIKLENSFASFLGSIDLGKDEEIIKKNKEILIKEVEKIIILLSELINDIKNKFVNNYGTEKT